MSSSPLPLDVVRSVWLMTTVWSFTTVMIIANICVNTWKRVSIEERSLWSHQLHPPISETNARRAGTELERIEDFNGMCGRTKVWLPNHVNFVQWNKFYQVLHINKLNMNSKKNQILKWIVCCAGTTLWFAFYVILFQQIFLYLLMQTLH